MLGVHEVDGSKPAAVIQQRHEPKAIEGGRLLSSFEYRSARVYPEDEEQKSNFDCLSKGKREQPLGLL
jgi:hypothetical protein